MGNCEEELPKKTCQQSVRRLLPDCWQIVSRHLANCWPTVGRQVLPQTQTTSRPTDIRSTKQTPKKDRAYLATRTQQTLNRVPVAHVVVHRAVTREVVSSRL